LSKNPAHIPSYYFLGKIFLEEEDYRKAIEIYKKLNEIAPAEIPGVTEILKGYYEKAPELMHYTGILYKEIGDLNSATELFTKLFDGAPDFADTLLPQLKEIILKNEKSVSTYMLLSKIHSFKNEYEQAIEYLKKVEILLPEKKEEILLRQGQLYFEKGEINRTLEIYTRLLQETKDRKLVYKTIRKIRNDYFNQKLKITTGETDDDRLLRANIYLLMDKIHDAERELESMNPESWQKKDCIILKARIFLKKNQPIDALETIRALPVNRETGLLYADIYEALGSYTAAASALKEVGDSTLYPRIERYEKLAQERRLGRGRYFIEGRI
jgi:tetratricopeptide (TPR) repeat protein